MKHIKERALARIEKELASEGILKQAIFKMLPDAQERTTFYSDRSASMPRPNNWRKTFANFTGGKAPRYNRRSTCDVDGVPVQLVVLKDLDTCLLFLEPEEARGPVKTHEELDHIWSLLQWPFGRGRSYDKNTIESNPLPGGVAKTLKGAMLDKYAFNLFKGMPVVTEVKPVKGGQSKYACTAIIDDYKVHVDFDENGVVYIKNK